MRVKGLKISVLFLLICLLLASCSTDTATKSKPSASFYPVGETQAIKYKYPNRPYDSNLTLEGYGWQDGKFYVVLTNQDINGNIYSVVSKRLSPRVKIGDMPVILTEFLWEEGSREVFKGSVYRYAVTVKDPEEIRIDEARFVVSKTLPASVEPPKPAYMTEKNQQFTGTIELEGRTYTPTQFVVNKDKRELTLSVESKTETVENRYRKFLLLDDKNRIYTFASQPTAFTAGTNAFTLPINEEIPADVTELQLIIFQAELLQAHLYSVHIEHKWRVF
jgi:hypothetical protein